MPESFTKLGIPLFRHQQVRELEELYASQTASGTYSQMLAAGAGAFEQLIQHWPKARRILVLTGKGNNAGDGFVLALLAHQKQLQVTLCELQPAKTLGGDALKAYQELQLCNHYCSKFNDLSLQQFDVIVDAMLGTGLSGVLRQPYIEVIEKVNQSQIPVLAIDIPSGLEANTGYRQNVAIKAKLTVTMIAHKCGLWTGSAAEHCGKLVLLPLGIAPHLLAACAPQAVTCNWSNVASRLPVRQLASHKGDYGHCLVIGGAKGLGGAAMLTAIAAARVGSGKTSAWLQQDAQALLSRQPEIMALNISEHDIQEKLTRLDKINVVVIGPGLGQSDWANSFNQHFRLINECSDIMQVVDADGLNWLAQNPNFNDRRILTPHPGEAARLLACTSEQVKATRFESAAEIARRYGGVCVLKGAGTIISDANGNQSVCTVSNPAMASAGMGDVLAGVVGGLVAQKIALFSAAELAVCLHAEAAEILTLKRKGFRGILAGDLIGEFPDILNNAHIPAKLTDG